MKKKLNDKTGKLLKNNNKKGKLPESDFIWKSDIENIRHSAEYEEVSRADWWRRWLYSTNAKDILRHEGLFQYTFTGSLHLNEYGKLNKVYPVDDLELIEKQGGSFRLQVFNAINVGVLMNRGIRLGMQKRSYDTCRTFKRITW